MLLRPDKTFDQAIKLLDDIMQGGLNDTRNAIPHIGAPSFDHLMPTALLAYERWTNSAVTQLHEIFMPGPVIERVRAEKYWIIVSSSPELPRTASMIHTELSELQSYFMQLANELRTLRERYSPGPWVVLDTNDLLHYYRFDNIPWTALHGKDVRVVIPHVVLDEIDTKSYGAGPNIQKRARGVYRLLENLLSDIESQGYAVLQDGTKFEVLADDPGHIRLHNNDDEIVARASFLHQAASPATVTLITRDIGMRARALAQKVKVAKLPDKYLIREEGLSTVELNKALDSISPANDGTTSS